MGIRRIGHLGGGAVGVAPPKDNYPFTVRGTAGTDTYAVTAGTACKFHTDGTIEKVGATDTPGIIAIESGDDEDKVRGMWIVPGAIYEASYDGTPHGNFKIGARARLHADSNKVDATNVTKGVCTIIHINTTDKTCRFVFGRSIVHTDESA